MDEGESNNPVLCFILGPSEHIHHCLSLPSAAVAAPDVVQGATPEESYINVMTWIHDAVTKVQGFDDKNSCHSTVAVQYTPDESASLTHKWFPRLPLVYQKLSCDLCAAIICKFAYHQWGKDCLKEGVSMGTIVLTRPIQCGPFLGVPGV